MIASSLLLRVLIGFVLFATLPPGTAIAGGPQNCDQSRQRLIFVRVESKDGRVVDDLHPEDLAISINKIPAQILQLESRADRPLSVAILIDKSRSQENVLEGTKLAVRKFIQSVLRPDKDLAALVSFSGEATIEQDLTKDLPRLLAAIDRVAIGPHPDDLAALIMGRTSPTEAEYLAMATAIWDAVWATTDGMFKSGNSRRVIVLLTDGSDTISKTKLRHAIEKAGSHGVTVFSLGISDENYLGVKVKKDDLKRLSQETGGRAFFPKKVRDLDPIFLAIEEELRSPYLLTYCLANQESRSSPLRIKIEIMNPKLRKSDLKLSYRYYGL